MTQRIVLAYSGSLAGSAAIAWLIEHHGAEVVTLTLDVGQSGELDEIRTRALSCGAVRAHVIDARDACARGCILPALRDAASIMALDTIAYPLIARMLVDVAAIEGASRVAHASTATGMDDAVNAVDAATHVLAPAREWAMDADALSEYARRHNLPIGRETSRHQPHLLARRSIDPAFAPETRASLEITFDDGIPSAVNGVPMALTELIESLSLIAGQHGIGHADTTPAPAAIVLRAAYAAVQGEASVARLMLHKGAYTITPSSDRDAAMVTHS